MTSPVLSIEGLTFGYPERRLFVDWSAAFGPGVSWIVGGDGSGKTSLMKLIAGDLQAQAGRFNVNGVRLPDSSSGTRPEVAWFDPASDALDQVSALDLYERLRNDRPAFDASLLARHVDGFGLAPHLAKPLYQLSTGSRRKVFIAASLASGALVTLLDQPGAALDEASTRYLMKALAELSTPPGRAVLVCDHELPDAGLPLAAIVRLEP